MIHMPINGDMINEHTHGCMIHMYINRHDEQSHREILCTGTQTRGHGAHKHIET